MSGDGDERISRSADPPRDAPSWVVGRTLNHRGGMGKVHGQRFLIVVPAEEAEPSVITLVVNWREGLELER